MAVVTALAVEAVTYQQGVKEAVAAAAVMATGC